ncbi:MAG: calcium-translocating P-type ATPase, PMCA-type [Gemmataceae bacterium]
MRPLSQIFQELPASTETGLSLEAVEKSRRLFGENRLTPLPREPLWKKFLEKFDEPIIKILLAAALLSMLVDLFKFQSYGVGATGLAFLVLGVVGLYVARVSQWIPTFLFGLAIFLFIGGAASGHFLVEGLAVMVAVILATGVAFISEYKSDREFEVLNSRRDAINVKVIRDGVLQTILLEDVVVGETILLEMGDEIPADGRLVKATDLFVDQSLMTGESEPVRKSVRAQDDALDGPEQPGCLYRGTQVVDGIGQMVVTDVGDSTYLGLIAKKLTEETMEEDEAEEGDTQTRRVKEKLTISKALTPLQIKLQNLAELISKVGYIAAVAIFIALVVRGWIAHTIFLPTNGAEALAVFGELLDAFVLMVIIIVVAVPEGLPMSVTVSLALAMQKMTRANSLVRQLVACETIGSATVICSDKTGTLTQNKMQVVRLVTGSSDVERGKSDWPSLQSSTVMNPSKPMDWLALNCGVNSTANLETKKGKLMVVGNSTEGSLLQWLHENGVEYQKLRLEFPELYQIHFSSERKRMTTIIRMDGKLVVLVKGAPEWVLDSSASVMSDNGSVKALTQKGKEEILDRLQDAASQAMRTLGFAYAQLPDGTPDSEDALHDLRESLESNLVFLGFVAIRDPLRDDVKDAIGECRSAGIQVKMITGDNVETARAIAHEIGLVERRDAAINSSDSAILTSDAFNQLSDAELKERLPRLTVLARARPLDKFRMVKVLQDLGEVVAVTGDGTNDAPALKKADVGLAMGIAGTEVAKEASKIVLLDDAFSTIVHAVHWGRSLYENIQRFIQFQLTINVSALTIAFLGPLLFGVKAPFTVLQLLWINVIMDTFASIALCSEPPRPGVMKVPPKKKDEDILTPTMKTTILATAAFFVVVMLGLLVMMKGNPAKPGLFASSDPGTQWSLEASGSRMTVAADAIEPELNSKTGQVSDWRLKDRPEIRGDVSFTVFQISLFFSIYVFFQVWNQINCRSLTPEESGFRGILQNPVFLMIGGAVALGQILIVTIGGNVFKVEPLGVSTWLAIIAFTATVLLFSEGIRQIRKRSMKTSEERR